MHDKGSILHRRTQIFGYPLVLLGAHCRLGEQFYASVGTNMSAFYHGFELFDILDHYHIGVHLSHKPKHLRMTYFPENHQLSSDFGHTCVCHTDLVLKLKHNRASTVNKLNSKRFSLRIHYRRLSVRPYEHRRTPVQAVYRDQPKGLKPRQFLFIMYYGPERVKRGAVAGRKIFLRHINSTNHPSTKPGM